MNRVSAQSDDLRKMQQEAMRRVQEMQNRSQSYVRSSNEKFPESFTAAAQAEQEHPRAEGGEYTKSKDNKERAQQGKPVQRVRPTQRSTAVQPPIAPAIAEERPAQHHSEDNCQTELNAENRQPSTAPVCEESPLTDQPSENGRQFTNNDILIVLLIILLLNGNKTNSSVLLALLSLFI